MHIGESPSQTILKADASGNNHAHIRGSHGAADN
jgi:hypothetical protein